MKIKAAALILTMALCSPALFADALYGKCIRDSGNSFDRRECKQSLEARTSHEDLTRIWMCNPRAARELWRMRVGYSRPYEGRPEAGILFECPFFREWFYRPIWKGDMRRGD